MTSNDSDKSLLSEDIRNDEETSGCDSPRDGGCNRDKKNEWALPMTGMPKSESDGIPTSKNGEKQLETVSDEDYASSETFDLTENETNPNEETESPYSQGSKHPTTTPTADAEMYSDEDWDHLFLEEEEVSMTNEDLLEAFYEELGQKSDLLTDVGRERGRERARKKAAAIRLTKKIGNLPSLVETNQVRKIRDMTVSYDPPISTFGPGTFGIKFDAPALEWQTWDFEVLPHKQVEYIRERMFDTPLAALVLQPKRISYSTRPKNSSPLATTSSLPTMSSIDSQMVFEDDRSQWVFRPTFFECRSDGGSYDRLPTVGEMLPPGPYARQVTDEIMQELNQTYLASPTDMSLGLNQFFPIRAAEDALAGTMNFISDAVTVAWKTRGDDAGPGVGFYRVTIQLQPRTSINAWVGPLLRVESDEEKAERTEKEEWEASVRRDHVGGQAEEQAKIDAGPPRSEDTQLEVETPVDDTSVSVFFTQTLEEGEITEKERVAERKATKKRDKRRRREREINKENDQLQPRKNRKRLSRTQKKRWNTFVDVVADQSARAKEEAIRTHQPPETPFYEFDEHHQLLSLFHSDDETPIVTRSRPAPRYDPSESSEVELIRDLLNPRPVQRAVESIEGYIARHDGDQSLSTETVRRDEFHGPVRNPTPHPDYGTTSALGYPSNEDTESADEDRLSLNVGFSLDMVNYVSNGGTVLPTPPPLPPRKIRRTCQFCKE